MARRKADELEDFSGREVKESKVPREDVELGSNLVKSILLQWRDTVKEKGIEDEMGMRNTFKDLLDQNKEALDGNRWIQETMAL
jgi:hypothetical protein